MAKQSHLSTVVTVDEEYLSVKYWREEFHKLKPVFESLRHIANLIAPLSNTKTSADWLQSLASISADKGGLKLTRDAVKAMNAVIQADPDRQKLLKILQSQRRSKI